MNIRDIKPTNNELRVMLETGFILRESAKFKDAESVFQGCVEFMPDSEVPKVGLATVYLQKGDSDSAINIFKEALELNPESDYARVHYGEALLFQNKRSEAELELQKVIESSPNSTYSTTAQNLLNAADLMFDN